MKNIIVNTYSIFAVIAAVVVSLCFYLPRIASAQTADDFLVTWRADTFAPAGFSGKLFPMIQNSNIAISFEILQNGKLMSLKNRFVKVFVNNVKIVEGFGVQQVRFPTNGFSKTYAVRIVVLDSENNVAFENTSIIPSLLNPEIVISPAPAYSKIDSGTHTFTALPYFFNISSTNDLVYLWEVNGKSPSSGAVSRADQLALEIPDGYPRNTPLSITLSTQNKKLDSEAVGATLSFIKQ